MKWFCVILENRLQRQACWEIHYSSVWLNPLVKKILYNLIIYVYNSNPKCTHMSIFHSNVVCFIIFSLIFHSRFSVLRSSFSDSILCSLCLQSKAYIFNVTTSTLFIFLPYRKTHIPYIHFILRNGWRLIKVSYRPGPILAHGPKVRPG